MTLVSTECDGKMKFAKKPAFLRRSAPAAIGGDALVGEPQGFGRGDMAPVREHRFLHPAQIMGVIYMPHEVDDVGSDFDVMVVG